MAYDAKDGKDNVVKDSENTSRDLSMGAMQTDGLPQGGTTSRPECQSHPNVRTQTCSIPPRHHSPHHLN